MIYRLLLTILRSEMATRHLTTKMKPQITQHIAAWNNYKKLFGFIASSSGDDFVISTQWIYDITQEFAYQFQGFCQFRGQVASHSQETLRLLQENPDVWSYAEVKNLLNNIIKGGKLDSAHMPLVPNQSPVLQQFAYFATIELARLECLVGEHAASLQHISKFKIGDRSELFTTLPICNFNVMYHIGVCNMMLQRFHDALDAFSDIIMYVLRILKPGAGATLRPGVPAQLQRMMDKALSLASILIVLNPSYPVEDAIREAAEAKFGDKMRRLRDGDRQSAVELFESSCPKFISAAIPDYSSPVSVHNIVFEQQSASFISEVMQYIPFFKLRSFLSMYASVDIQKLARFMELTEADLLALLNSFKAKVELQRTSNKSIRAINDYMFTIADGVLTVTAAPSKNVDLAHERYFVAGTKKHRETMAQLNRTFATIGI